MSNSKRKRCSSPKVIEFEEEEQGSALVDRGKQGELKTSQGRFRDNSNGEGYVNEDREV
jgi:hypothetical protein